MTTLLPSLAFRDMDGLTATNTLYTMRFRPFVTPESRYAVGVLFLTRDVREQLRRDGRVYPGGLLKFEPENIYNVRLRWPVPVQGARGALRAATACLLSGKERDAEGLADEWLADRLAARSTVAISASVAMEAGGAAER
jgi:hypothetical protein